MMSMIVVTFSSSNKNNNNNCYSVSRKEVTHKSNGEQFDDDIMSQSLKFDRFRKSRSLNERGKQVIIATIIIIAKQNKLN